MKRLVFALLVLLTVVPAVNAATVSYSGSYNGLTDVTNKPINVSQFNPSLGTLVSVSFQLDATMNTSAFATNDGDFYAGWDKMQYQFSLMGDSGYSSVGISASMGPGRIVGSGTPGSDFHDGANPTMAHIVGQPSWTQTGPTLTDSQTFSESPLAAFIGTGNLSFFLTTVNQDTLAVGGLQTNGSPNPAPFGNSTNILADVLVTYDYTPVPLPAAFLLVGTGLVPFIRLRKKTLMA